MSIMTKRQIESMMKKIEKHRDAVGRTRDALGEAIGALEGLRSCCEDAWDNMQRAHDALSELA
jgi:hypothetical protein